MDVAFGIFELTNNLSWNFYLVIRKVTSIILQNLIDLKLLLNAARKVCSA